ncbi:MAG: EAL domain-containing protein, partial [Clostridiales bacterium]|nr:EAL domain-containing protein [Clostridiales bacterium]
PGKKTKEEYDDIARGLIDLFKTPFLVGNYELDASANIGICICPYDAQDEDSIRKQAKAALLRAKREEKNSYKYFSSDLNIQNYKEFVLRNDLHRAIEEDQLRVFYQPIVNLKTGEILAVEALIRWMHPEWGLVLPEEFIYLAEEIGVIIDIGKWIIRQVCESYKRWLDMGLPSIKVAVKASGIQLMESEFANKIKNIIDEYELDPEFLIIEITENTLLKDIDKLTSHIETLRSFGIKIALNNFGTGFCSFECLSKFKVDIVKLSGCFLKDVPANGTNAAIAESIVNLVRGLKIKMFAKGIENWNQLSYLKYLNCHAGQGNIFSQEVDSEEIEKILAKRKCRPLIVSDVKVPIKEERRRFFRINLPLPLESVLEVLEIKGRKANVGNTKVLIKNIGPGGLCFVSDIKFPVQNSIILQFTFQLLDEEIKVRGNIVWAGKTEDNLNQYGIEFTIDENERADLIKILNQVQIKVRKNIHYSLLLKCARSAPSTSSVSYRKSSPLLLTNIILLSVSMYAFIMVS